jgi:hypothetical protein
VLARGAAAASAASASRRRSDTACDRALTGFRLFPDGLFRTWNYAGYRDLAFSQQQQISPSDIFETLTALCQDVHRRLNFAIEPDEALRTIAGIEWELSVGPIHPFYDACGRISRYYSTLLSVWFSVPVIDRGGRETYFDFSRRGRAAFQDYIMSRPRLLLPQ